MDSNKVLIGAVVAVVAFLAFPIAAKKIQEARQGGAVGTSQAKSTGTAGTVLAVAKYPELEQPPLLSESSLAGTSWALVSSNYRMKVTLAPGGVLYITHPMAKALTGLDYIEGRWRVEYNKLFVSASAAGNDVSRELRIGGNRLYSLNSDGKPTPVESF